MPDNAFVDTNILVYARDPGAKTKHRIAFDLVDRLWTERTGRISVQVLSEFYVCVTRKLKPGLSEAEAWQDLELLRAWNPAPTDWKLMRRACELAQAHAFSWWDALIVASALAQDCKLLYSEDLQHGQRVDGLRIINPFHTA